MRRKPILIYSIIIALVILLIGFYYLTNIYGDVIEIEPKDFYASPNSYLTLQIVPVNSFGLKALFRKSSGKFIISEGADLVEIISINENDGKMVLRSLGISGKLGIKIISAHSLFPNYVEIAIQKLLA